MIVFIEGEGNVWECDGCGDTAAAYEAAGAWAMVTVHWMHFVLCSCDCFSAWNYHVTWGDWIGNRPGVVYEDMPF